MSRRQPRSLRARLATLGRNTAVLTLVFWLGIFSASKFDSVLTPRPTTAGEAAPAFPQHFAEAICAKDGDYLAPLVSPGFGATPDDFARALNGMFDTCTSVTYLGSYDTEVDGAIDYVFVLHYDKGSNFWVFTVYENLVVQIQ